ncbi:hypothetical protein DU508_03270 [Pedobacter chinensis]|uniref:Uncharacterized protein n=1 Tax=Pedobacter chinensis TaxID=2282421 RepID=A0A369Q3E2_9SPHI|nr:hypothetical protein [Pedobacter chinensis]RDC57985.1 hypothetical protein DU508_03270 [Pedobacter chinensis]
MKVNENTSKNDLDKIQVGDTIEDDNGNKGTVAKIDISKYRKFEQYYFRILGDGTIDILKNRFVYAKK